MSNTPPPIPFRQLQPGDVLRWQCLLFPNVTHRWRVLAVCLGGQQPDGSWTESLIEVENVSHASGITSSGVRASVMAIPEVLTRECMIEDVGDYFGLPSARRWAR
ncbi:hypothetical protein [Falsiroseomonas sp. CW058]|uniref:hypothetical protein n=1 Tax=Falsiroseomonas sp. CW058 TaxID=3388664 RepID=UPI003D32395C